MIICGYSGMYLRVRARECWCGVRACRLARAHPCVLVHDARTYRYVTDMALIEGNALEIKQACLFMCLHTHTSETSPTHTHTCASGRAGEIFVAPHNARPGALVVLSPGWCRSVRQGERAGACSKLEAYSKFVGHVGVLTRPGVGGSWFALNACTHAHTHNRTHSRARTDTCV